MPTSSAYSPDAPWASRPATATASVLRGIMGIPMKLSMLASGSCVSAATGLVLSPLLPPLQLLKGGELVPSACD